MDNNLLPVRDDVCLRKLIRSVRTKAFLTQEGTWTKDIQKGMILSEALQAKELRDHMHPEELEIYYSFDEHRQCQFDFALPVH